MKNMRTIGLILTILGLLAAGFFLGGFIKTAYGSDYANCVAECKADVMDPNQCVKKEYWDSENTSQWQIKLSCEDLIRNEKLDCQIDCMIEEVKIENAKWNRSVKFWDKNVRSFPDTNQ